MKKQVKHCTVFLLIVLLSITLRLNPVGIIQVEFATYIKSQQRIVLLAGPHKTSSTSEQVNIIKWVNNGKLPSWSWPLPEINESGLCNYETDPKLFGVYIRAFSRHNWGTRCLHKFYKNQGLSREAFVSNFEEGLRNAWREGKNLIIASEMMDIIASEKNFRRNRLMDYILHAMPWNSDDNPPTKLEGSNDDITVVVNFRSPRVEHLISLWHECCIDNMTLQEYLASNKTELLSLDSLMLANEFLMKGIAVILVDMSGVSFQGYDISNVIACDVLSANCTSNKELVGDMMPPSVLNVKNRSHNITENQLDMIENIIRRYDCNFMDIIDHDNVTILYPKDLMTILGECKNIPLSDRITKKSDLVQRLSHFAKIHLNA